MKHRIRTGVAASVGMLLLILDTKTALYGANDGIHLCITTVIPSLFPFVFLSNLLTSAMSGSQFSILRFLGHCMRMPNGSESLFLIGGLGGYPTGAQAVAAAYSNGQLMKKDAQRLLGFCSNAGPAFIFGITAAQFPDAASSWLLWIIHLLSAFLTGILLPGGSKNSVKIPSGRALTAVESLRKSTLVMAQICGWIILFRITLAFANRWFFWLLGNDLQIIANGFIEASIGCISLSGISSLGMRFVAGSAILGFGGLCVMMQTASTVGSLGLGMYIPGKLIQCCISIGLAATLQNFLYLPAQRLRVHPIYYIMIPLIIVFMIILAKKSENRSRNSQLLVV